ncbi:hypothetical protein F4778DRAFT_789264 [Xylariomycetidae sp. FL2044]|nr:hypothetical protein F4778DRAFT_789264 [Xylariomycetidae sp. FL2044]
MDINIDRRVWEDDAFVSDDNVPGSIVSSIVSVLATSILSACFTQRYLAVTKWRRLALIPWLVFLIYGGSWAFVFATVLLQYGFRLPKSYETCSAATFLCVLCYATTKAIHLFLVERAVSPVVLHVTGGPGPKLTETKYIIRGNRKPRMRSKLYLFNSVGMLAIYCVTAILNFIYRFVDWRPGLCKIGWRDVSMFPMICFDLVANVYLTVLFLTSMKCLYKFNNLLPNSATMKLRSAATRAFVGTCVTVASSLTNLTALTVLRGQPAWLCLTCCRADIIISAIVIQWITANDCGKTQQRSPRLRGQIRSRPLLEVRSPDDGIPLPQTVPSAQRAPDIIFGAREEIISPQQAEEHEMAILSLSGGMNGLDEELSGDEVSNQATSQVIELASVSRPMTTHAHVRSDIESGRHRKRSG